MTAAQLATTDNRQSSATPESFAAAGFVRIPLAIRFPLVVLDRTFDALDELVESGEVEDLTRIQAYAARFIARQLARMSVFDYSRESFEFRVNYLARRAIKLERLITLAYALRAVAPTKEVTI